MKTKVDKTATVHLTGVAASPAIGTGNTTTTNTTNTIADAKYDDLFGVTPRELEKRIQSAKESLGDVVTTGDINALIRNQSMIAQWEELKGQIETRARKEGKI